VDVVGLTGALVDGLTGVLVDGLTGASVVTGSGALVDGLTGALVDSFAGACVDGLTGAWVGALFPGHVELSHSHRLTLSSQTRPPAAQSISNRRPSLHFTNPSQRVQL